MKTERYKVILIYDGAEFSGFQRQANARTVQEVVEVALRQLGWQGKSILAAGRTDTGVHAEGQVVAFDLEWRHSTSELKHALNAHLPQDVAAREILAVHGDFHPRYDAISRRYRYRLFCQEDRDPLLERYAWRVWPPADFNILHQTARLLVGRHDFAAFGTPPRPGGSTIRTVFHAGWQCDGLLFDFSITADAFLYRMVRRLVFIQVQASQGLLGPEEIGRFLENTAAQTPSGLAPPQGLSLVEVEYPEMGLEE